MSRTILSGATISLPRVDNIAKGTRTITSNTTLDETDENVIIGTIAAAIGVTLPAISSLYNGKTLNIVMSDVTTGYQCAILCNVADTFEDGSTIIYVFSGHITVTVYGSVWIVQGDRRSDAHTTRTQIVSTNVTLSPEVETVLANPGSNITITLPNGNAVHTGKRIKFVKSVATAFYYRIDTTASYPFVDGTRYFYVYNLGDVDVEWRSTGGWKIMSGPPRYTMYANTLQAAIGAATDVTINTTPIRQTSDFCSAALQTVTFAGVSGVYNIDLYLRLSDTTLKSQITFQLVDSVNAPYATGTTMLDAAGDTTIVHLHVRHKYLAAGSTLKARVTPSAGNFDILASANDEYCLHIEKLD